LIFSSNLNEGTKYFTGGWIWCKYYVCMYENGKIRPVETIPGMEWGDKG
jgi:hypothetical protein